VGAWALLLASVAGCSRANGEGTARARQSIAGGTVDLSHQDVFLLAWHAGQTGALCTATLIAPNLLLTARHCVSPFDDESERVLCGDAVLGDPYPPSAFFATNDAQPREGSPFFGATDVRVPAAGVDTCGYDIALIILQQSVPAALSTPAVPRIDREPTPGEPYTAVGYGETESGQPSGSRMQLTGLSVACQPGSCGEGVESTEFLGETGVCSGDSGGPALDADGKVVGVVSRGGPDCSEPVYGSVAAWRDFIVTTAREAAALGGYQPAFWVTSGSSEPAPVLGGAGADGSGAGGAPTETSGATAGESCKAAGDCHDGLVCYAAKSGEPGVCTPTCSATVACEGGKVCKSVDDVFLCAPNTNRVVDATDGCTLAAAPGSGAPWSSLLAASGAAWAWQRRRRATIKRG
jgi:hypothetical protein